MSTTSATTTLQDDSIQNFKLSSAESQQSSGGLFDEERGPENHSWSVQDAKAKDPRSNGSHLFVWMFINTIATIGIVGMHTENENQSTDRLQVFANKALFNDSIFKTTNAQITFATYHFALISILLYTLSTPRFGMFEAQRAPVMKTLPLAAAMWLNLILPNLSLAYCSVILYQIARILTRSVAAINFFVYHTTISRPAGYTLFPLCVGVGLVSYYDAIASVGANAKSTTTAGMFFAFSGVVASSFYTVWIGVYHKRL